MRKHISICGTCALSIVFAATPSLWAQSVPAYAPDSFAAESTRLPPPASAPQIPAAGQATTGEPVYQLSANMGAAPLASAEGPAPASGTEDRIKALEAQLKKIMDKEAEAKKKAAGAPSVRPIGRLFWDTATFSQNPASRTQAGDAYNGTEFRNARIGLVGDAFEVVGYKIEMDFAAQTSFKDVYVQIKELPAAQNARFGHFYEAFGLEAQTSTANTTFMEKSLINEFGGVGGYKPGVMVYGSNENKRLFWQIEGCTSVTTDKPPTMPYDSLTGNSNDFNGGIGAYGLFDDDGGYAATMRGAGLVWYDEATDGRGLFETGMSYSYRTIPGLVAGQTKRYRLRSKPESNLAPYVITTPWLDDADQVNALGPEMMFVYGPFSLQGEYLWEWVHRTASAPVMFDGGYMYVSYFLTGENRVVERDILRPGRVRPFENFFRVRTDDGSIETGKGAWEVAYRFSYANLGDVGGGRLADHTFGLNWYLNPYTRMMFNFVHSETTDRDPGTGVLNAYMTRVQIDL
jgi:phosphate-selective porin OprO and OprP